jgi:hypothetical protein
MSDWLVLLLCVEFFYAVDLTTRFITRRPEEEKLANHIDVAAPYHPELTAHA